MCITPFNQCLIAPGFLIKTQPVTKRKDYEGDVNAADYLAVSGVSPKAVSNPGKQVNVYASDMAILIENKPRTPANGQTTVFNCSNIIAGVVIKPCDMPGLPWGDRCLIRRCHESV